MDKIMLSILVARNAHCIFKGLQTTNIPRGIADRSLAMLHTWNQGEPVKVIQRKVLLVHGREVLSVEVFTCSSGDEAVSETVVMK
jgi:hypothetical protein